MLSSGIICIAASAFMLYLIHLDYLCKRHNLRMFQFGLFGFLLLIGFLQIMSAVAYFNVGFVPEQYKNMYSIGFILLCLLIFPYFRYNKRKEKDHVKT